ncbi:MAG: hypothetical protein IPO22_08060 [Anaerolineales bacterium]|nr:hypothetical protein [Anaerolineales bacterium]
MKKNLFGILALILAMFACSAPAAEATPTPMPPTETEMPAFTFTPEATFTPEFTLTPTTTFMPTVTFTPTISATPTFAFPTVTVNKQAHCRYGPSSAYLHAADLYPGDVGSVTGRALYSSWLYIKFEKIDYYCWVSPSVVDVVGDISTIKKFEPNLQSIGSNMYGPPQNVDAYRNGDYVVITWDQMEMSDDKDRGYLIEAFVCQDGAYIWWTFSYPDQFTTDYEVKDEAGCAAASYGRIYTVEKHGFSDPTDIPWPKP